MPTQFSASIASGSSVSYAWDFGDGEVGSGADVSADRWINLNITVANLASTNSARLREILEMVPESARPALEEAISNLEVNYRKAIESLNEP